MPRRCPTTCRPTRPTPEHLFRYEPGISVTSSVGRFGIGDIRIRGFVERAAQEDGRAIVIPFRVQGFGPYGRVLEGLDYAANERGLVPNAQVREWVDRQARMLAAGRW